MRGVNFDAIEAGLLRALRGGDIGGGRRGDALFGHLLRNDGLERRFINRMRNGRRRDRRFAADVDAGMAAAVAELDRGLGAAAVDFRDQPRQAGNEAVVIDADLVAAMPAGLFRRRHFHRDQPGAAAHPRHVIGDAVVGDKTLGVRRARRHRRHDDAVFDFDRPDARRGEKDVGHSVGISPPSRSMVAPCIQVRARRYQEGDHIGDVVDGAEAGDAEAAAHFLARLVLRPAGALHLGLDALPQPVGLDHARMDAVDLHALLLAAIGETFGKRGDRGVDGSADGELRGRLAAAGAADRNQRSAPFLSRAARRHAPAAHGRRI